MSCCIDQKQPPAKTAVSVAAKAGVAKESEAFHGVVRRPEVRAGAAHIYSFCGGFQISAAVDAPDQGLYRPRHV
jgi:hypothetical protein